MANQDSATYTIRCSGNAPKGLLSKTKVSIVPLTAGNFAAQIAKVQALGAAEANLTLGVLAAESVQHDLSGSAAYPSTAANRGDKWIISASNPTGRKFTYTIPALDNTANLQSDGYTADLSSTAWAAYKTAFDAVAVDPAGNSLTLDSANTGGRRR